MSDSDEHAPANAHAAADAEHAGASGAPLDDASLARILADRGIPPDEISRLLKTASVPSPTPILTDAKPEVTVPLAPKPFEPHPSLTFPPFREPSPADVEQAERLLREAHIARRRGRFEDAFQACHAAIDRCPHDAAALEMLGDILQALGRVDDAVAAYRRSGEADPSRRSAERKYAELVLMQDRMASPMSLAVEPKNPYLAVLLSAVCPGAGQYYNGETAKGLVLALVTLALIVALLWSPLGFAGEAIGLTPTSTALIAAIGIVYVIGLADANIGARNPRRRGSGWDV